MSYALFIKRESIVHHLKILYCALLQDFDASDTELLIYATTLINRCLNNVPDRDTYYDQVRIRQTHLNLPISLKNLSFYSILKQYFVFLVRRLFSLCQTSRCFYLNWPYSRC